MTVPFNKTAVWQVDYTPAFENELLACNQTLHNQVVQAAQANNHALTKVLTEACKKLDHLVTLMEDLEKANNPLNLLHQVIDPFGVISPNRYVLRSGKFIVYYDVDLLLHTCWGEKFTRDP